MRVRHVLIGKVIVHTGPVETVGLVTGGFLRAGAPPNSDSIWQNFNCLIEIPKNTKPKMEAEEVAEWEGLDAEDVVIVQSHVRTCQ